MKSPSSTSTSLPRDKDDRGKPNFESGVRKEEGAIIFYLDSDSRAKLPSAKRNGKERRGQKRPVVGGPRGHDPQLSLLLLLLLLLLLFSSSSSS